MTNLSTLDSFALLSSRELDVLCLMTRSMTNQQIAGELFISKESVRAVIRSINNKLGTPSFDNSTAIRQATIDIALRHNLCSKVHDSSINVKNNLPNQMTTFIGRGKELLQLTNMLSDPNNRLISIVAPGGMGKTRLALAFAKRQLSNFVDGVYFVPLTAVTTEDGIINEIVTQMKVLFQSDNRSPKQQLLDILREKNRLLILDNFEQLIQHTSLINDILTTASQVNIMVTSRERLGLKGETVFRLDGLDIEDDDASILFIDSLKHMKPDFQANEDDLAHIQRISELVGGMPLALILAANWIELLSLSEIGDEIATSLDLLSEDLQDTPGIRAVFDRTWGRLTEKQQQVFTALSVCVGGFTRESAKAIANANLVILKQLADKSLIQQTEAGRYSIHELVRQYARERLEQSATSKDVCDCYSAYYSDFVSQREKHVKGAEQVRALDEIEADFGNIEAAWHWAIDHTQPEKTLPMLECLFWVAEYRSRYFIVRDMLRYAYDRLQSAPDVASERLYGQIIAYKYEIEETLGDLVISNREVREQIKEQLQISLTIAQEHGYKRDIAISLQSFPGTLVTPQEHQQAINIWQQCCELYQELGDKTRLALCYDQIGHCYHVLGQHDRTYEIDKLTIQIAESSSNQFALCNHLLTYAGGLIYNKDFVEALEIAERVLTISREIGSVTEECVALNYFGRITFFTGDFDGSYMYYSEILRIALSTEGIQELGRAYTGLGLVSVIRENYEEGRDYSQKSYDLFVDTQQYLAVWAEFGVSLAYCGLEDYESARLYLINPIHQLKGSRLTSRILQTCVPAAIIYAHTGDPEHAIELLGLTLTHPGSFSGWMHKWDLLTRLRADLEAELGAELYQQAWERGTKLDPDEVLNELVQWIEGEQKDDLSVE